MKRFLFSAVMTLVIMCMLRSSNAYCESSPYIRLAHFESQKGPMDFFYDDKSEVAYLFIQRINHDDQYRETVFLAWDDVSSRYYITNKKKLTDKETTSLFKVRGLFFQSSPIKSGSVNPVYLYNKQLRLDAKIHDQQMSVFVRVMSNNTYTEKVSLSIYRNKGIHSEKIYSEILINESNDIHLSELMLCDLNKDGFVEIVLGIIDGGSNTNHIYIYAPQENPWRQQDIGKW